MTMITPILIVIILPTTLLIVFSAMSTQTNKDREKSSSFECGFDPTSKARTPFSMRFFLLAILFLIFDIEIMFLLPLPILTNHTTFNSYFMSNMLFVLIITAGLLHEWNEGSLNWTN